jgi:transposase
MAMGTRKQREKQEGLWIAPQEWAAAPGHPFYQKLNELLNAERFDEFVEARCAKFYAAKYRRPSLTPGIYFRSLLIGYFEGIDGERGIAWRLADSLALRRFVGIALDELTPDHSTISRPRRLIDIDRHREVFAWVLGVLADRGLVSGDLKVFPQFMMYVRIGNVCVSRLYKPGENASATLPSFTNTRRLVEELTNGNRGGLCTGVPVSRSTARNPDCYHVQQRVGQYRFTWIRRENPQEM